MNIEIKQRKIESMPYNGEESARYEEFYFSANHKGKEIGHLISTKILEPIEDFEYFITNPIASFGSISQEYRRQGIAKKLLEETNKFCKEKYGQTIISGLEDSKAMKKVWEKLEQENKSRPQYFDNKKYWEMI